MTGLSETVALVVGGAGGIGLACAQALRDAGAAAVVVADLVAPALDAGQNLQYLNLDITESAACDEVVSAVLDRHGRLDALVVASGINYATFARRHGIAFDRSRRPSLLETDDKYWAEMIDVNLTGVMNICRAGARGMQAGGRGGSIVTTSSISGTRASRNNSAYSVSKAGVWMLTKCMAIELAEHGIRANAIAPGLVATAMTADLVDGDEATARALSSIPLSRKGIPTDIAAAALFLVSDASSFVTGTLLPVDGGEGAAQR